MKKFLQFAAIAGTAMALAAQTSAERAAGSSTRQSSFRSGGGNMRGSHFSGSGGTWRSQSFHSGSFGHSGFRGSTGFSQHWGGAVGGHNHWGGRSWGGWGHRDWGHRHCFIRNGITFFYFDAFPSVYYYYPSYSYYPAPVYYGSAVYDNPGYASTVPDTVAPTAPQPAATDINANYTQVGHDWGQDLRRDVVTWDQFVTYLKTYIAPAAPGARDAFRSAFIASYGTNAGAAFDKAMQQAAPPP